MAKIAIDVDDTLYSFTALARNVLAKRAAEFPNTQYMNTAYALWPEWRSPVDLLGVSTWLDVIDECHADKAILDQIPYPGAAGVLWELAEQGHELIYLSARNEERYAATSHWLGASRMPDGVLTCTGHDKTAHLAQCQFLVDDRPATLVKFVYDFDWKNRFGSLNGKKERKAFGLMTDFNRSLTDVPGIALAPNWNLLRHHFIKSGILGEKVTV